jgi:DNA polymerase I-like protein with 3'-5' exonuclease and polymerase domains
MIAIDIETYDPNLHALGPGCIRLDGAILCVGLYDGKDYVCCEVNDKRLIDWLASNEDKIFHNGVYDLAWLICGYGFDVGGTWHDTMTRAALIDEYADLDLDSCCKRFNLKGKNKEDTIEAWYNSIKKIWGLKGSIWDNAEILWLSSEGKEKMIQYNKQDCIATYNLFMEQEPIIKRDHAKAYQVECDLYPLLIDMKRLGIRVDIPALNKLTQHIVDELDTAETQLYNTYGITRDIIASPKQLSTAMTELGIVSTVHTPTGAPSWTADALELIDHPVIPMIQAVKNNAALLNKYLKGSLLDSIIDGRIHCTFSPNKRDDGGTITGRFASSHPNLQQVPARETKHGQKSYGQEMRSLFLPEEGMWLGAFDYSAMEAVMLAHYAKGSKAEWFKQQMIEGKDFHKIVMEMTGISDRDVIKRMNFGFIYGMGINKLVSINRTLFDKLAYEAGMLVNEYAEALYRTYHQKFPVIKDTMRWVEITTKQCGYIQSIGKRVHHKPKAYFMNGKMNDGIYKMTNYLIQGSCSDLLKLALVKAYKAGVFRELKLHLTVHDENVVSIPKTNRGIDAALYLKEYMETAYSERMTVPMRVAVEVGPNWGYWNDDIWKKIIQRPKEEIYDL